MIKPLYFLFISSVNENKLLTNYHYIIYKLKFFMTLNNINNQTTEDGRERVMEPINIDACVQNFFYHLLRKWLWFLQYV